MFKQPRTMWNDTHVVHFLHSNQFPDNSMEICLFFRTQSRENGPVRGRKKWSKFINYVFIQMRFDL